ncbi:magnesium chelatase [archaeon 13_1_40CM_4_53_4]|nr:MAG: magnesium chelatase [archaeon 13_2_20CM_2_53_6]OLC60986.1 MAG: magnesium chelatase [archaeon 13_1_40CM_4_53_4]OLE58620.1 MAG: magnesium chelatase [Crenarchaeota archaeon 13_1_20CM_2_53_14]TMI24219.1 MAG: MoxR family ATPase [Candidatus Bathyarchaeota archaeon]
MERLNIEEAGRTCQKVISQVKKVIVGKEPVLEKVMLAVLANSHILFEDYPGLAKTLLAKSFAMSMGCGFSRIQFTPDLLPADITGTYVFNVRSGEFELRKGPVFTNILLADEINRAPPKTQAALLEAMQEKQTTLDGKTHLLDNPFIVVATQNPIEYEGVYPLPEAQLDRFLVKLQLGYPARTEEVEIMHRRMLRGQEDVALDPVTDLRTILDLQQTVEGIHVDDDVMGYIADIVQATRSQRQIDVGASPRGSLAIFKLSRARAVFHGRDYVIPDDVKEVVASALVHRLIMKAESWVKGTSASQVLEEILRTIPVPRVKT